MTSKPMVAGATLVDMSAHGSLPAEARPSGAAAERVPMAERELATAFRPRASNERRVSVLARALEAEVIPRLVLSRHDPGRTSQRGDGLVPGPTLDDIETLIVLVTRGDITGAAGFAGGLQARNLSLERIYLELFAPTARRLGELWESDRCDFATVTIGLCCLQQLVLDNSRSFGPRAGPGDPDRRILLAPVPGEQHSFGLVMVGEFFRRQGWDVSSATGAAAGELVAMVRQHWFGIVGLSLACEDRLEALASVIRDVRRAARNQNIGVLVGGRVFSDRPELVAMVGADATSSDGRQAVLKAETLLTLLVRES